MPPVDLSDPDISRLLKAFRHEIPDRVPNFEYLIDSRNVSAIVGKPCGNSWTLGADDYIKLVRSIGMDAIGGKLFLENGQILSGVEPRTLSGRDGLHRLSKSGRLLPSRIHARQLDEYFQAIEGTKIGVWFHLSAGLTMAYDTIGLEDFCLLLYDDRPFVEELLDLILEDNLRIISALLKYDFSFFHIGDDLGYKAGLIFPPDLLREIWLPRLRRTVQPILDRGIPVTFHSDGMINEAIPMVIDLGFSSLNPIEPYGMDIFDIKQRFGAKLCLVGNIDVAGELAFGNPDQVEEDVREHLATLASGGGYVCATSHSVIDVIPPANFRALVSAVHRFGRYRADGSLAITY
jgi:hypothetical protein